MVIDGYRWLWMVIYRLYDETEGSTVFRAPRKQYRHPRAKRKGVFRFARGSKYRRPRGFHRIRYLYCTSMQPMKSLSVLATALASNRSV